MKKINFNYSDIVLIAISAFALASKIKLPFIYISAYTILMIITLGNGLIKHNKVETTKTTIFEILYKIYLIIFTISMSYLLVIRLKLC